VCELTVRYSDLHHSVYYTLQRPFPLKPMSLGVYYDMHHEWYTRLKVYGYITRCFIFFDRNRRSYPHRRLCRDVVVIIIIYAYTYNTSSCTITIVVLRCSNVILYKRPRKHSSQSAHMGTTIFFFHLLKTATSNAVEIRRRHYNRNIIYFFYLINNLLYNPIAVVNSRP